MALRLAAAGAAEPDFSAVFLIALSNPAPGYPVVRQAGLEGAAPVTAISCAEKNP